jgi:hypothetical protein
MPDLATPVLPGAAFDEDEPAHQMRRPLRSTLLTTIFFFGALTVIGISFATSNDGDWVWALVAALSGALSFVAVVIHIYLFHYRPTLQQYAADNQIVNIDYEKLRDDTRFFVEQLDSNQVSNFAENLISPKPGSVDGLDC